MSIGIFHLNPEDSHATSLSDTTSTQPVYRALPLCPTIHRPQVRVDRSHNLTNITKEESFEQHLHLRCAPV